MSQFSYFYAIQYRLLLKQSQAVNLYSFVANYGIYVSIKESLRLIAYYVFISYSRYISLPF